MEDKLKREKNSFAHLKLIHEVASFDFFFSLQLTLRSVKPDVASFAHELGYKIVRMNGKETSYQLPVVNIENSSVQDAVSRNQGREERILRSGSG
jgi:hypothetical protein